MPDRPGVPMQPRTRFAILAGFLAAFAFRLYFGLSVPPAIIADDEIQTYLIGLKSYATGTWPYFGPDVSAAADGGAPQLAGALQGLLVAVPLYVWPSPIAPYVALNLVTFAALTFFGAYAARRLPGFPRWFLFIWLFVAPWTTHFSTTMINTSWAMAGAVLFVIGFLEAVPRLACGMVTRRWANALMGFGLFWVAQLHMSWVMFCPLAVYAVYAQWRAGALAPALSFTGLGAAPMLALLVPTYVVHGFTTGGDLTGLTTMVDLSDIQRVFVVLGRYLSFSAFELPRFLGPGYRERVDAVLAMPWLAGPGFYLWAVGLLQPALLVGVWFVRRHPRPDWPAIKHTTLGLFLVVYVLFWFSGRSPISYRYVEALPLVMLYAFYCWDFLAAKRAWRIAGVVTLAAAVVFQVGYAWTCARDSRSVYARERARMARAIEGKDYRLLAERRPSAKY